MIKNTGRTGHSHSTTFHHARRKGPLSVVIGVSSLITIMHRTRLPISSILSAFLVEIFPSNLLKRTISLTRPHPHLQSYGPQALRGSQAHSGQWQRFSDNEFDGLVKEMGPRGRANSTLFFTGRGVVCFVRLRIQRFFVDDVPTRLDIRQIRVHD